MLNRVRWGLFVRILIHSITSLLMWDHQCMHKGYTCSLYGENYISFVLLQYKTSPQGAKWTR